MDLLVLVFVLGGCLLPFRLDLPGEVGGPPLYLPGEEPANPEEDKYCPYDKYDQYDACENRDDPCNERQETAPEDEYQHE